jgi:hypothetical protein
MRRLFAAVSALTLGLALAALSVTTTGCGSSSPTQVTATPTPAPTRSVIKISVSPDPIIAEDSGDPTYPYKISYDVTVTETAGLACNINRVITRYRNKTTGVEFGGHTYNPNDFIAGTGSNFIAGGTSKTFSLGTSYVLAYGGKQMTVTLTAEVIDAFNNVVTATTDVEVVKHSVGGHTD